MLLAVSSRTLRSFGDSFAAESWTQPESISLGVCSRSCVERQSLHGTAHAGITCNCGQIVSTVWPRGATLSTVREQDAKRIARDIFGHADKTGERITLGTVERRLAELAGHPPGHCQLCKAAANVTVQQVYRIAANWQAQLAVTRTPGAALRPRRSAGARSAGGGSRTVRPVGGGQCHRVDYGVTQVW